MKRNFKNFITIITLTIVCIYILPSNLVVFSLNRYMGILNTPFPKQTNKTSISDYSTKHLRKFVNIPDENLKAALNEVIGDERQANQDITNLELNNLTGELDLMNKNIVDLTGLEHCTNITTLKLAHNQIDDITQLSSLTNLTWLSLDDNKISDVTPLSGLTNLTELYLGWKRDSGNEITDVSPLGNLTNLTRLDLSNNKISDVSPLAKLTNLKWLDIPRNRITDISPLSKLTNLTTLWVDEQNIQGEEVKSQGSIASVDNVIKNVDGDPITPTENESYKYDSESNTITFNNISETGNKSYTFNQSVTIGNATSDFSGTVTHNVVYDQIVNIPDENLKAALNEVLGADRHPTQDISKSELQGLSGSLALYEREISDLTGLENCINIKSLDLGVNNITDLNPIVSLTNLTRLIIGRNQIQDISPIASLNNLNVLWIDNNKISDISSLQGLSNLTEIRLENQQIHGEEVTSVGSIAEVTNIIKGTDGNFISITDSDGYAYNVKTNKVTFNNITETGNKSYTFNQSVTIGNATSDFSGTVTHNVVYTKNLLLNDDFSEGITNWNKWPKNALIKIENNCIILNAETESNGINQDVSDLEAKSWYKLTAEVFADKANAISIAAKTSEDDKHYVTNKKINEWETLSVIFQVEDNKTTENISVWLDTGNAKARNLKLVKTTEPVNNENSELIYSNETFYIDARNGDDNNDGKSEETAWKSFKNVPKLRLRAGGKLLLKADCVWNGEQLKILEAIGSKENPILVGRYGLGDNPIINGNGNPWQKDINAPKENVAAVHIYNSEYINVENLEVTNWEYDEEDLMNDVENNPYKGIPVTSKIKHQQSKYLLTGILVENHDAGDLKGITVKNNYIHDINGYMDSGSRKGSGGLIALVTGNRVRSKFTDLSLINNEINNVSHQGIYMESSWYARNLVGNQQTDTNEWIGWPNIYVSNNYVHDIAGDGIVLINADGGIAEKNLVVKSASEDWNYSRNPAHAAIWMWNCNNVTMQYNEAAYTESYQDGMAFDFDYGNQNVMYQYNYSHHNKGGFLMSCPGPNYTVNAVARYNISINDGLFDGSRIIRIGEKGSIGNQIHNNTIYWDHGYDVSAVEQAEWGIPISSGTDIYNNIFYGDSDKLVNNSGVNYKNNLVYGTVSNVYPIAEDPNAIIADPQFVDSQGYNNGSFNNGVVNIGNVDGFKLKSSSPCIDKGMNFMTIPEKSFSNIKNELVKTHITIENKDYFGNYSPYDNKLIDIGAYEYQYK